MKRYEWEFPVAVAASSPQRQSAAGGEMPERPRLQLREIAPEAYPDRDFAIRGVVLDDIQNMESAAEELPGAPRTRLM